ncbi:ABC transporter permease subunit [Saccharomonospora sp. NPDC046836]|uniref:ABC transporter permease n=1 Tax=Saccharomonospora sp. NPDC046836 TaxID=3156921 RepID=UPI0033DDBCBA
MTLLSGTRPSAATPRRSRRRAVAPGPSRALVSGIAIAAALVSWWLFARVIDDSVVPGPVDVGARVAEIVISGDAAVNFASSIGKILAGFGIALILGIPIGFAMGRSRFLTGYFSLPLFLLGNLPGLVYAVFGLVVFGVGATGPIVVSALVSIPFVALNVSEGVRSVDGALLAMCRAFGRTPAQVARHLYVPALTGFVFTGIRYGFAMAWKVEALTEVFGARDGVGFMIRRAYQEFDVVGMLAWTALFVITMVLIERGLGLAERRLFAWRKDLR